MRRSVYFWAAGFLLLAIGWRVVEACSCLPQHPQTQYCDADFVVLAVPRGKTIDNGTSVLYTVQLKSIIKATRAAKASLRRGKIYTGLDSAQCGVELTINQTYILLGGVSDGKARINLCGFNSLWRDVTTEQRRGFQEDYKRSCGCTINTCFGGDCVKTSRSCVYNNNLDNSLYCYAAYGKCMKNRSGVCDWVKSRRYEHAYSPLAECLNTTISNV